MPKSMCNGCKYWEVAEEFDLTKFHYCAKFATNNLHERKVMCGGRYYSTKD